MTKGKRVGAARSNYVVLRPRRGGVDMDRIYRVRGAVLLERERGVKRVGDTGRLKRWVGREFFDRE